jgi:cysteine-rich repeat protein
VGITELCDDSNLTDADGCDSNCKPTACGNGVVTMTTGETCDDSNTTSGDGCDSNCKPTGCGNGVVTTGPVGDTEVCDDGNLTSGDGCDSNCKPTGCGNGITTAGEVCDDGNTDDTDDCVGNCVMARCGDTFIHADDETCDDGNAITEACTYGQTSCTVCDSTCHSVAGAASFCNDGTLQTLFETCDDGNMACGTCSADCKVSASAQAVGTIAVVRAMDYSENSMAPGPDTFTLDDGINPPVTFEFTRDAIVGIGNIAIDISMAGNANSVANLVRNTIISVATSLTPPFLDITAISTNGSVVNLRHERFTKLGNVTITETVTNLDFGVTGMSGGAGGDCTSGQVCQSDNDCLSNVCVTATKLCM